MNGVSNYIPYWYEKFGKDYMQTWMKKYELEPTSFVFRFQPSHLLDKIENSDDLMEFSEYVNGFKESKLVSYYAAECNNFYHMKNQITLELDDTEDEDNDNFNEIIELVWDNIQDISMNVSAIKDYSEKINKIFELTNQINDVLSGLNTKQVEKNAKFQQVKEIQDMIKELQTNILLQNDKFSTIRKLNYKSIAIMTVVAILFFILGGMLL